MPEEETAIPTAMMRASFRDSSTFTLHWAIAKVFLLFFFFSFFCSTDWEELQEAGFTFAIPHGSRGGERRRMVLQCVENVIGFSFLNASRIIARFSVLLVLLACSYTYMGNRADAYKFPLDQTPSNRSKGC